MCQTEKPREAVPLRIGFDIRSLHTDGPLWGVGVYAYNLLLNLASLDAENEYFLMHHARGDAHPGLTWPESFKVTYLKVPGSVKYPNVFRDRLFLRSDLTPFNLDVIHFTNPMGLSLDFDLGSLNPRTIITMFDLIPLRFSNQIFVHRRRPLKFIYDFLLRSVRKVAHIIAISHSTKTDLGKFLNIPPEKITVTHLGVRPGFNSAVKQERLGEIIDKYRLPSRYLFYVGNFFPYKNLERLLDALIILSDRHGLSIPLVIGGKIHPFFRDEVHKSVSSRSLSDRVIFTGYIPDDDLPCLYRAASAFVLPSLYEGFGLPVLEAMACGTPVACSSTSSLPEVAGDAALLFDPDSCESIAEALMRALSDEDLRKDLSAKGVRRAAHFSWETCARETLQVYRSIYDSRVTR